MVLEGGSRVPPRRLKLTAQAVIANITPVPKTYKAAVFKKKGAPFVHKDLELKYPSAGQVLVKVIATGVCHSDDGVRSGEIGNSFPIVPGHEVIGDIAALGDCEKRWKVGDRVGRRGTADMMAPANNASEDQMQMCQNAAVNGVTQDGGFAEYVLLRTEVVINVPKDVDPVEYAPILCAGITVFNSVRKLNITHTQVGNWSLCRAWDDWDILLCNIRIRWIIESWH